MHVSIADDARQSRQEVPMKKHRATSMLADHEGDGYMLANYHHKRARSANVELPAKRSPMKPLLKAVLIYENFAAGIRARWFCERLARALDCTLEAKMWNFDVLRIREDRNAAASAARKSDIVVVSLSGHAELPGTIRAWLDMWLWLLEKENPALVGLFDSSVPRNITSIRSYLGGIARRAGIDFLPHEITYKGPQSVISPVTSAKPARSNW